MMKPAVTVSLLLAATVAHADPDTTHADTLVVVTPSAPVIVTNGAAAPAPSQAPGMVPYGAEEEPPGAPPAAPQNERWDNVSHINGTLVPVGEKTRYLYDYKKTNLMADPFGMFWGYWDASVSHGVTQNLAVSITAAAWSMANSTHTGYQVAATVPIYFRRTYSGPFLEPGLIFRSTTRHYDVAYACGDCGGSGSPTETWAGPEMLFGWQWIFDSGLNVAMAFGVARHLTDNKMSTGSSDDSPDANGYFRIGYAF